MITAKKPGAATNALLALTISTSATALLVPGMALAADNETPNADKTGFMAGSSLNLLNRNMFVNKEFRNNAADEQSYQQEWAHGINTEFESGYTEGVIGFGLDAHIYAGFKLDTGDGTNGWGLLPVDEDGHADDQYGELGGAVKMRMSATELKYGDLRPNNPMLATGDQALDPETATGFHLISNEVDGLTVEAGHFTAYNNVGSSNSDDELESNYGGGKAGESLDLGGATYAINDQLTVTGYLSQYKETWDQYYANANYTIPLSEEQSLNFDVNVYRTNDTGDGLQGEINNTSYSAAAAYTVGAHTLTMAYQTIHGNTPFDYVGHDSISLNNAMQLSDFNAPNEKSFRVG
jgi:imipenem/basic amino acid-specific outer membrane pore